MSVLSAQGGTILTPAAWSSQNCGYLYGSHCSESDYYKLARQYVAEKNFCADSEFDHSLDCFYLKNNCHIEDRGGHRYLRPSLCSKMVFKKSAAIFNDSSWLYSYHGTASKNVQSILKNGLLYPGYNKNVKVEKVNGGAYGDGVYTSKLPLYAQLYADVEYWRGKFVQVLFLVRQAPASITQYGAEGCYTRNMIGRTDIHRLYDGRVKADEFQFVTRVVENNNIVQALLIKIHEQRPDQPGGEYYEIKEILENV